VRNVFLGLFISSLLIPISAQSQVLREIDYTWEPDISFNERVFSIAYDPDSNWVYYGGTFGNVQIRNTYFSLLDTSFSTQKVSAPRLTHEDSQSSVRVILDDGSGGWYIGGQENTAFDGFLHIDGDGNTINDGVSFNGPIRSIKKFNDNLFITGFFNRVDGLEIDNMAILNLDGDSIIPFGPRMSETPTDFTLIDSLLFVAGKAGFEGEWNLGGTPVDILNQEITRAPYDNAGIDEIIADGSGGWFFGGEEMNLDDSLRYGLAQIDISGNVTAFNHKVNGIVNDLFLYNDTLYLGGLFTAVDGIPRKNIAAISLLTDSLTDLNTEINGPVTHLYVNSDSLIVHGLFTVVGDNRVALGDVNLEDYSEEYFMNPVEGEVPYALPIPGGGFYLFQADNIASWYESFALLGSGGELSDKFGSFRDYSGHINHEGELTSWECEVIFSDLSSNNLNISDYAFYENVLIIVGRGKIGDEIINGLIAIDRNTGEYLEDYFPEDFSINFTTEIDLYGDHLITHEMGVLQSYSLIDQTIHFFEDPPNGFVSDVSAEDDVLNVLGSFESFESGASASHFAQYSLETYENLYSDITLSYPFGDKVLSWGGNIYFVNQGLDSINYQPRTWFAAVNAETGTLLDIEFPDFNLGSNPRPYINENYLYLQTEDYEHFRINLITNQIDTLWGRDDYLSVARGERAAVLKNPFNGTRRYRSCALNKNGEVLSWNPVEINGIEISDTEQLDEYTLFLRNGSWHSIYQIDNASGEIQTLVSIPSFIGQMALYDENLIFCGGFEELNGEIRLKMAEIDAITGELTEKIFIDPEVFEENLLHVNSLALKGDTLFVSGLFRIISDNVSLEPGEYRVVAFDVNSAELLDWNLELSFSPGSGSILVQDSIIYLRFQEIGLNQTGTLEVYNLNSQSFEEHPLPQPESGNNFSTLIDEVTLLSAGSVLYVYGIFDNVNQIKAFDVANGYEELWSQPAEADQLFIYGDTLIITHINWIVEDEFRYIAGIDVNSGQFLDWAPMGSESLITGANLYRASLFEDYLAIAGRFWTNQSFQTVLKLNLQTNEFENQGSSIDYISVSSSLSKIRALSLNENGLGISGDFRAAGGIQRRHFMVEDLNNQTVKDISYDFNGSRVSSVILYHDSMYIAGSFSQVNGLPRNQFFSAHRITGEISEWNPFDGINTGQVPLLALLGDTLLLSANIEHAFGQERDKGAMINLSNHELLNFDTDVLATTYAVSGDRLFLGGEFTEAEGLPRDGIAAYSLQTGELLDWQANGLIVPPVINLNLAANDTALFVREILTEESGTARRLAAIDPITGEVFPNFYEQSFYSPYGDIELWKDHILIANNDNFRIQSIAENITFPWDEFKQGVTEIKVSDSLIFVNGAIFKTDLCEINAVCADTLINLDVSGLVIDHADLITVSSPCGHEIEIVNTTEFFNCTELGLQEIQIVAIDSHGQAKTCLANIHLVDTLDPVVECTQISASLQQNGTLDADLSQVFTGSLGSCNSSSINIIPEQVFFTCEDLGQQFEVVVEVTDASGNINSCSGSVSLIVNDTDGDGVDESCDICYGNDTSGDDDGDGICNDSEISGCQNPDASNYNPFATDPAQCFFEPSEPSSILEDPSYLVLIGGFPEDRMNPASSSREIHEGIISVYPNPAHSRIQIDIFSPCNEACVTHLEILNSLGQVVTIKNLMLERGVNSISYDTSDWSLGMYFIRIPFDNTTLTAKLLIVN
jgi:hypothetical protein